MSDTSSEPKYYACIRNDKVENIIYADNSFIKEIQSNWDTIVDIQDLYPFHPSLGSIYNVSEGVFSDAESVEVLPIVDENIFGLNNVSAESLDPSISVIDQAVQNIFNSNL